MSTNNLAEQLSWLLSTRPFVPPPATPSPGWDSEEPSLQDLGVVPVSSLEGDSAGQLEATVDLTREDCNPTLEAAGAMARLQVEPTPAKKLQFAQSAPAISTDAQQGKKTVGRDVSSTSRVRSRDQASREVLGPDAVRHTDRQGSSTLPTPTCLNVQPRLQPLADIDSIDLTGDDPGNTSSSGTMEVFGEATPIWREDSASRAEPLPPRGKKRKSSELDVVSSYEKCQDGPVQQKGRRQQPRISEGFVAVDRYLDEDPPPYSSGGYRPPTPHEFGNHPRRPSLTNNPAVRIYEEDDGDDDECTIMETRITTETHTTRATSRTALVTGANPSSSAGRRDGYPPRHPRQPNHSPPASLEKGASSLYQAKGNAVPSSGRNPTLVDRCEVQDSESDDVGVDELVVSAKKQSADASGGPIAAKSPTWTCYHQTTEAIGQNPLAVARGGTPKHHQSGDGADKPAPLPTSELKSPSERQTPTPTPTPLPASSHAVSSLPAAKPPAAVGGGDGEDPVERFLKLPDPGIDAVSARLSRALKENAEAVSTCLKAGQSLPGPLKDERKRLRGQLEQCTLLPGARDQIVRLRREGRDVREKIFRALDEDVDSEALEAVNGRISTELRRVEGEVRRALDGLGLLHLGEPTFTPLVSASAQNDPEGDGGSGAVRLDTGRTSSANPGRFQAPSPAPTTDPVRHNRFEQWPDRDKGPGTSDSANVAVRATPVPLCRHQELGRPSSQEIAGIEAFSPRMGNETGSRNDLRQRPLIPDVPAADASSGNRGNGRTNTAIGRTMCDSAQWPDSDQDDEYGDDGDDSAMLDLENSLASLPPPLQSRPSGSRRILGETSGNFAAAGAVQGQERRRPKTNALPTASQSSLLQHPWSRDVKQAMKETFHLRGFRPNQLEAINATLAGKDAFVLMPTGGGKSLCYQLPGVIQSGKTRGVTVVISPLLSLMQDQVDHLQKLNIKSFLINGEVTARQRAQIFQKLGDDHVERLVQLLYVTPEMLSMSQTIISAFQDLYRRGKFARMVIDEAHCVSEWGHDFRPDYKALGRVRTQFPGVPVVALTATATENVKIDVITNLRMDGCEIFSQSFNRPNLRYEVRSKNKNADLLESIANTIHTLHNGQTGIVYCLSRSNCETVASKLAEEHGISAHHYHAKMTPAEKSRVQKAWQAGQYLVIVATIAFGMGIDKADVRFVIHHAIPKSLEGYYQETGRAGRDGKRSDCYLYYARRDIYLLRRMIYSGEASLEQKTRANEMLANVVQFCENNSDCRRVQVLAYFNEAFRREGCHGGCDNCNTGYSNFETRDFTHQATAAVRLVKRFHPKNVTIRQYVDVFCGVRSKNSPQPDPTELPEFGAGEDLDRSDVERLLQRLLIEGALLEHRTMSGAGFAKKYIHLGPQCNELLAGKRQISLQVRSSFGTIRRDEARLAGGRTRNGGCGGGSGLSVDHPQSTNVSSPIQQAKQRRQRRRKPSPEPSARQNLHSNGYADDGFVVSDEQDIDDDSSDTDGFEPLRVAGESRSATQLSLGPPITTDESMSKLDGIHRMVVDEFVRVAKIEGEKIRSEKGLRAQPFTDSIYRQMAILFPKDQKEMGKIRGIDTDKVGRYGKRFCKLIQMAHENYQSMMGFKGDGPVDPNHRLVIDLSSDDDDVNAADFGPAADVQAVRPPDQRSGYFQSEPEGNGFNPQPQSPRSTRTGSRLQEFTFQRNARPEPSIRASRRPSSGPKQSNTRRGLGRFPRRAAAGGASTAGRPSKRKSASARSSNGNAGTGTRRAAAAGASSSTTTAAAARSFSRNVRGASLTGGTGGDGFGGGGGGGGGIGGIGMMPT